MTIRVFATVFVFAAILFRCVRCSTTEEQRLYDIEARLSALEKECSCVPNDDDVHAPRSALRTGVSNTIAFSAWRDSDELVNFDDAIIYEMVDANLGDAYDSSTGIFTCLVDGYYVFSVFAMTASEGQSHYNLAAINVGGTLKTAAMADESHWDQGSMTVLTRCSAGTQVFVQHKQETSAHYGFKPSGHVANSFLGYLVSIA